MTTSHSARSRFLDLIRRDLLELDAAGLDFNAKGEQRCYLPVAARAPGAGHPGERRLAFEHRTLTDEEQARIGRSGTQGAALLTRCPHLPLNTGLFDEGARRLHAAIPGHAGTSPPKPKPWPIFL